MSMHKNPANILWSFISWILLIYGLLIFAAGLYYWYFHMKEAALSNLHPSVWWGLILIVFGLLFRFINRLARKKEEKEQALEQNKKAKDEAPLD